jgi:hypothetical protein
MGRHRRIGLGAGVAALAAMTVAGCSGGGSNHDGSAIPGIGTGAGAFGGGSAISLVSDSMNLASKADTVKITGTMTLAGKTPMSANITAQEQYSPAIEMSMSLGMDGQNISEVLVGTTMYIEYPGLSSMMDGKSWGEIDLSKATGALGSVSTLLDSAKSYNPTTQISALLASGTVSEVGTQTVDGQQTTHYRGTLDSAQLLKLSASQAHLTASQLSTLQSEFKTGGLTSETVDLWVGSDKLPVEIKMSEGTADGTTEMDMHMSDWGAPVNIGAPPANEVYNLTAQFNSALNGSGSK